MTLSEPGADGGNSDRADNGSPGSSDFYVISGGLRLFSTFEAVTSVALADEGR